MGRVGASPSRERGQGHGTGPRYQRSWDGEPSGWEALVGPGSGVGEGYASGETKAQRCSAPWHVCFPNQGSEQQVRPGEQVTSKTELTLCPGRITATGCLLGRWGRGGRQAGGHPSDPPSGTARAHAHAPTCPTRACTAPHSASGRRPGLHLPCVLNPRGGSAQGGWGAVEAPGHARPAPEPLTQQRAGCHRAPFLVPLSVNGPVRRGEGSGSVWFQI